MNVIAMPASGRIFDHLQSSMGEWNLSRLKFLVQYIGYLSFRLRDLHTTPRSWMRRITF
jgi:hypothetical protein